MFCLENLSQKEKDYLLKLARESIRASLSGDNSEPKGIPKDLPSPELLEYCACFVSLHENGDLRGCIGALEAREQLWLNVFHNAKLAAFGDPRFAPLSQNEFEKIQIEISVLTPPKALEYKGTEDLLKKLVPLKHGVILKKGWNSATFLPQVWEQLPEKQEFLMHLSAKAGLGPDGWKDAEYKTYEAIVFHEDKK